MFHDRYPQRGPDFLLLDLKQWKVQGIRVHTDYGVTSRDNAPHLTHIDGIRDLENARPGEGAGFGAFRPKSAPGLIAADFILHSEGLQSLRTIKKSEIFSGMFGDILHAKQIAHTMEHHLIRTDRAERAARRMSGRILAELRGEPSPETKESEQPSDS